MEYFEVTIYSISVLSYFILILYAVSSLKKSVVKNLFILQLILLIVWSLSYLHISNIAADNVFHDIGDIAWILFVTISFHFVMTVLNKKILKNTFLNYLFIYLPAACLIYLLLDDYFFINNYFSEHYSNKQFSYVYYYIYFFYVVSITITSTLFIFFIGLKSKIKSIGYFSYMAILGAMATFSMSCIFFILLYYYQITNISVVNPFLILFYIIGITLGMKHFRKYSVNRDLKITHILNSFTDAVVVTDKNFLITEINSTFQRLINYELKLKIIDKSLEKIIDKEAYIMIRNLLIEDSFFTEKEMPVLFFNTYRRYLQISGHAIIDDNSEVFAYVLFFKDITSLIKTQEDLIKNNTELELKVLERTKELDEINSKLMSEVIERVNAENVLRESENKYRFIVENVSEVLFTLTFEGKIDFITKNIESLFGYTPEEVKGTYFFDYIHPEDIEKTSQNFRNVINKIIDSIEFRVISKDKKVYYVKATGHFIEEEGKIVCLYGILNNITDLKLAEMELRSMLEEKNTLLKEVHHRVKNNLQIIISLLKLESYASDNPHVNKVFNAFIERLTSMKLVHEKLYMSENIKNINIKQYFHELLMHLEASFLVNKDTHIILNSKVENENLSLDTLIPLGLIVNELLSNSFKYAFPDKIGMVNLEFLKKGENDYYLCISDNGVGFDAQIMQNGGKSLGLKLVNALVNQIDGNLIVETDKGSKFEIYFKDKHLNN